MYFYSSQSTLFSKFVFADYSNADYTDSHLLSPDWYGSQSVSSDLETKKPLNV